MNWKLLFEVKEEEKVFLSLFDKFEKDVFLACPQTLDTAYINVCSGKKLLASSKLEAQNVSGQKKYNPNCHTFSLEGGAN